MSLKSTPAYWVECDGCGAKPDSEYGGWSSPEQAVEEAVIDDNFIDKEDGTHYCPDCSHWCLCCDEVWIPKIDDLCPNCKEQVS